MEFVQFGRRLSSNFDPDNYYNPADTYSESKEVRFGSSISSQEFALTNEYFFSVGYIAGALAITGIVAMLGLGLGLCCRYFFTCCECRPQPLHADGTLIDMDDEDEDNYEEDNPDDKYHFNHVRNYDLYRTYPWNSYRICNFGFLLFFLAAAVTFDQFFLVARTNSLEGVQIIKEDINRFSSLVSIVKNDSSNLVDYGEVIEIQYNKSKAFNSPICIPLQSSEFQSYIHDYQSNVEQLNTFVAPLSGNINSVNDYFDYYAEGSFLFIFWGIPLLIFALILLFVLAEKRYALQLMVGIGSFFEIILILLGVIFICFVMIFGDFCTDPTYNLLNSISGMGDIQSIANYYATCQGNTTIQVDLHSASSMVDQFYSALVLVKTACPTDVYIDQMIGTLTVINSTVNDIVLHTNCGAIQPIWFDFVNNGICTKFYNGVFYIWSSQILTCLCFFVTLVILTITYQFYPKFPLRKDRFTRLLSGDLDEHDAFFNIDVPSNDPNHQDVSSFDPNNDDEGVEMMLPTTTPQSMEP
jgi:hypothetical protein